MLNLPSPADEAAANLAERILYLLTKNIDLKATSQDWERTKTEALTRRERDLHQAQTALVKLDNPKTRWSKEHREQLDIEFFADGNGRSTCF